MAIFFLIFLSVPFLIDPFWPKKSSAGGGYRSSFPAVLSYKLGHAPRLSPVQDFCQNGEHQRAPGKSEDDQNGDI